MPYSQKYRYSLRRAVLGLLLFVVAGAAHAQLSRVESEMGAVSFDRVAPIIKELAQTGAYLKPAAVALQLKQQLNVQVAIAAKKPGRKITAGAEIYRQLKAATVVLISNGLRATAAVIDESGILVTNYHVLEMFGDTLRKSNQPLFAMTADGSFYPVLEILSCAKINDLAVIRVGGMAGHKLHALALGETLPEGSDLYVMGHPAHITYFFSKGIVAKNFIRDKALQNADEDYRMAVTADYSLGMSGGPIVDESNNLIGLVSAANALYGNPQQKINPQMVFKNAIPVIALKKLIKQQNQP